jgi:uncharacterized protein YdaU (DUF1376 family)
MSWQAKGLYRELLDEFWAEGILPLDHAELADICGCTVEEFSKFWPEMAGCWEVTEGGLVNAKMDSMRTDLDSLRVKRAKAAKDAAIARLASASAEQNQADAQQVPASAEQVSASASKCHIAEQSRAEQRIPSRKRAAKSEPDPRHTPFREQLGKAWAHKNPGVEMPWDVSEAAQLSSLLQASPSLDVATLRRFLNNWHKSEVNHAERPRVWLARITDYANGPLDRFGQPMGVSKPQIVTTPTTALDEIRERNRRAQEEVDRELKNAG